MKKLLIILFFMMISASQVSNADKTEDWLTYYENSGFKETPRFDATIEYCDKLAKSSKYIKFSDFGISPQGRKLPLLIVDKKKKFKPVDLEKRKRPVILIQACIHPGESDGKDAGLMLIRDIVIHKMQIDLLDDVVILFIPIFGVDGHERFSAYNRINQNGPKEMGWRVTSQNLNLNRDFLKADSPEMRGWLKMFTEWLPDFLVDCHVTDGLDHQYAVAYLVANRQNMVEPVRDWLNDYYIPILTDRMKESEFPIIPYGGFSDRADLTKGMMTWLASPRFSHGYGAIQNRPFLLVETHMLKDYKTRVDGTYQLLMHTLEMVRDQSEQYLEILREGDKMTSDMAGQDYSLRYQISHDTMTTIEYLGYEAEVVPSDISGGDWIRWDNRKPVTYQVPHMKVAVPTVTIKMPYAYIIPPEWLEQIEILKLHGVEIKRLNQDSSIPVESYRFTEFSWQEHPYEGRHPVEFSVENIKENRLYPKGSVVVLCNQRTNRVLAQILEPQGYDSFVSWGFFDGIFEQKEYAEDYVMEKLAREMMSKDSGLKEEFEEKLLADSAFAASPFERLNFFYKHSPYWDDKISIYPVGKITKPQLIEQILEDH
ncbi:MAG: peptidase M14 [candidate division Zixibacteria bacterium]|nr:peptidase M14 [candidate division Zixibacteria bacterium]